MAGGLRQVAALVGAAALAGGVAYLLWSRKGGLFSAPGTPEDEAIPAAAATEAATEAARLGQDKPSSKQILVLGLDGAGKTSVLHSLATNHVKRSTAPTEGINAVCINTEETKMEFLEISPHAGSSSERLQELAKPKTIKDVWNLSRRLVWGNQETIWPLSTCALTSRPSSRILALAKPKAKLDGALQCRSLFVYSCGRESEIWHRPPNLYSIMPSKRILQLAEPRQCLDIYLNQRPQISPQWLDNPPAIHSNASPRILLLAQPRCLHPCFTLPREAETHVSRAARRALASSRTENLAHPVLKKYPVSYDNRCVEAPIRQVSPAALQAVPSPRIVELAKAKALSAKCSPDRSPMWPVSAAAKHAVATPRLEELSQPPKRAPTHLVQFDPEAFTVKETAKKAFCSDRLKELAQPIKR